MADKRKTPKSPLERLTEDERSQIQAKLPPGYLIDQYIDDMQTLQYEINDLIRSGKEFVDAKEYGLAGTTFTDVSDLQDIYTVFSRGKLSKGRVLVESLDTAVRDHLPVRLYDQMYRD